MELKEKAAYLKGLAEGLEYDKESKEGKLIAALIDLTAELCEAVEVLDTDMDEIVDEVVELREYIEEIDDDLNDVEEFLDEEVDLDDDWDDYIAELEALGVNRYLELYNENRNQG